MSNAVEKIQCCVTRYNSCFWKCRNQLPFSSSLHAFLHPPLHPSLHPPLHPSLKSCLCFQYEEARLEKEQAHSSQLVAYQEQCQNQLNIMKEQCKVQVNCNNIMAAVRCCLLLIYNRSVSGVAYYFILNEHNNWRFDNVRRSYNYNI